MLDPLIGLLACGAMSNRLAVLTHVRGNNNTLNAALALIMVGSTPGERKHLMEGGINDFGGFLDGPGALQSRFGWRGAHMSS